MPPKTRITREMILDAAFQLARESGIESVNARTISGRLNCSTQPVMYCFATIDEIRREIFQRADSFHTEYIMNIQSDDPMLDIGLSYVRFAAQEKHLFRFLFQSDHFATQSLFTMINDEELKPIIEILCSSYGISEAEAKEEFISRFMMVHGMASLLANNSMVYDEKMILRLLERQFPN